MDKLSQDRDTGVLWALRVYCLLLIGLHLLAPRLAEEQAWGLWPMTYLPALWRWLLAAMVAVLCLPGVTGRATSALGRLLDRLAHRLRSRQQTSVSRLSLSRHTLFAIIALLALIPFTLFRIVHTRWGDAYILVNGISHPDPAVRLTATWQAPLDVWLHVQVWQVGHSLFGWTDAWPAYRLLSPLAGALYVYVLLRLADSVGRNRTEKLLIVGLMGTLGTMQLFFGYAENYSLAATGILVFLWLGLETLRGERPPWQASLALAITNGLHPSTIVFVPALLTMAWAWARRRQVDGDIANQGTAGSPWRTALWQVAVPMLVVAAAVILLMELSNHGLAMLVSTDRPGGGDARWFVPLKEVSTRWERYTMFSWAHLRDWLNQQLLAAPVTLGGLVIAGSGLILSRRRQSERSNSAQSNAEPGTSELVFLAVSAGMALLFTWVWNPDYGGQRDWDLFSLAAIPSTLLLARLLPAALPDRGQLSQAGLMLTAVSAMHTAAWIYQNTLPWEWP